MFEKFLSAGWESFRQRYEGTYGFYRDESGKRILVRLSVIRDNVCVFLDSKEIEYRLNADSEKNIGFEFIPPKSCWYNTADGACLVQRVAARQFQRGISGKNINIYNLDKGQLLDNRIGFAILTKVYENNITPQEGLSGFLTKGLSLALANQFALSGDRVFLYSDVIGSYTIRDGEITFKLAEPSLWRTEIQDACKALSLTAKIT